MIIATVLKSGGIYTPEHVYKLRDMVSKYIPCGTFTCLTDLDLDVETISLTDGYEGWWAKIELFKIKGPVLFFDLDTIIRGDISHIIEKVKDEKFVILRDFYRKGNSMQSSMMYWNSDMSFICEKFKENKATFEGDQDFIESVVDKAVYWQDVSDEIVSFKCNILRRELLDSDKVVIFHGQPRPWRQHVIPY